MVHFGAHKKKYTATKQKYASTSNESISKLPIITEKEAVLAELAKKGKKFAEDSGYSSGNSQEPLENDFFRAEEDARRQVLDDSGDQNLEIAFDMQHNIRHIAHDVFNIPTELRITRVIGDSVRGARKIGLLILSRASDELRRAVVRILTPITNMIVQAVGSIVFLMEFQPVCGIVDNKSLFEMIFQNLPSKYASEFCQNLKRCEIAKKVS
ncbi:Oidioi.mRNA.OKI2018_I69.XSR.g14392.t1.cds [Oikopleura dioica]|uniref:Oidioi.mRNA.OKI2018_I69.XSR.g14392.t1.cds n=1 Tax=Oikopleura dioica TaxID=34765 RepID=A0ABN7SFX8_OIKDI|nr:Oidioi.mRNA.OKI2018_I69.XSR.g14392.t1.cds [Oikopleura dioica]